MKHENIKKIITRDSTKNQHVSSVNSSNLGRIFLNERFHWNSDVASLTTCSYWIPAIPNCPRKLAISI